MKTLLSLALTATLPVCALSAQTTTLVYPPELADPMEGNTADNYFPLGLRPPARQMLVFNAEKNFNGSPLGIGPPIPNGKMITKIGFRKNGSGDSVPPLFPTPTLVIFEMWMADAARTADNPANTFADNYVPGTEMLVFSGNPFELPRLTQADPILWFTLDTPFPYNANTGLVVDFRVTLNSNQNQAFTYPVDVHNSTFGSPFEEYGMPCLGFAGNDLRFSIDAMELGSSTAFRVSNGFGNSMVQIGLAFSKRTMPLVIPSVGGPCELLIDPIAFTGGMLSSGGSFSIGATVPNDLTLKDITIHGQAFASEPFVAWPLKVISSNGYGRTIGYRPQLGLVKANGSVQQPLPLSGGAFTRFGVVTMIEYMN